MKRITPRKIRRPRSNNHPERAKNTIKNEDKLTALIPEVARGEIPIAEIFQLFFVHEVAKMAQDAGLSHSEFGRLVFGETSGSRIWRTARDLSRRRAISVADCYTIADVLQVDLPSMIWQITQRATPENLTAFLASLIESGKFEGK